jgi:hypothetical protein
VPLDLPANGRRVTPVSNISSCIATQDFMHVRPGSFPQQMHYAMASLLEISLRSRATDARLRTASLSLLRLTSIACQTTMTY